jgi:ABC-type transporter Mla subunit MlaD
MLERILAIVFEPITNQLEDLVATVEQLQAAVETFSQRLDEAKGRIQEDVAELRRLLEERIDPDELDPVIEKLNQMQANVEAIDPEPAFPPENPPQPDPSEEGEPA